MAAATELRDGVRIRVTLALHHGEELVGGDILQFLHDPGGPLDAQGRDIRGVTEAEVGDQTIVEANPLAGDFPHLPEGPASDRRVHTDLGPDA